MLKNYTASWMLFMPAEKHTNKEYTVSATFKYVDPDDTSSIAYNTLTVKRGDGSGRYTKGTTVTITADVAEEGYRFLMWTGDTETISKRLASTAEIEVTGDYTVTATYFQPSNPEYYTLTIINGSPNSDFYGGETVNIYADDPEEGNEFWKWSGDTETVTDIYSSETQLVMPLYAVTLTALYKVEGSVDLYTLTVNYGDGDGDYEVGTQVTITAQTPAEGFEFAYWAGNTETIDVVYNSTATLTMPAYDITITAVYQEIKYYTLVVNNGGGTGSYQAGTTVAIYGTLVSDDEYQYTFNTWSGDTTNIADLTAVETTLVMPAVAQTITAEYTISPYLTVVNGSTSGFYPENSTVNITADTPDEGYVFCEWTGDIEYLSNTTSVTTNVTMPSVPIKVTATYEWQYGTNNIGYYISLKSDNETLTLETNSITIVTGEMSVGMIISDSYGNLGVVTKTDTDTTTILKVYNSD